MTQRSRDGHEAAPPDEPGVGRLLKKRVPLSKQVEKEVLTATRRRCCLCWGLESNASERQGQIAHLDDNPGNGDIDNLAFLCHDHHSRFDSTSRQSKGYQILEVKHYRDLLKKRFTDSLPCSMPTGGGGTALQIEGGGAAEATRGQGVVQESLGQVELPQGGSTAPPSTGGEPCSERDIGGGSPGRGDWRLTVGKALAAAAVIAIGWLAAAPDYEHPTRARDGLVRAVARDAKVVGQAVATTEAADCHEASADCRSLVYRCGPDTIKLGPGADDRAPRLGAASGEHAKVPSRLSALVPGGAKTVSASGLLSIPVVSQLAAFIRSAGSTPKGSGKVAVLTGAIALAAAAVSYAAGAEAEPDCRTGLFRELLTKPDFRREAWETYFAVSREAR